MVIRGPADAQRAREWFREMFRDHCQTQHGRGLIFSVRPYTPPRTQSQNATQHMWYGEIAEQTGHTPAEVKDWLKDELLPKVEVTIRGRTKLQAKETSALSKAEAIEYMEAIQALASDMGFFLTQPDGDSMLRWRDEADSERRAAA